MTTRYPLIILGSGHSVPGNAVASGILDEREGLTSGWLYRHSGVRNRYVCVSESQIDLAVEASQKALEEAGVSRVNSVPFFSAPRSDISPFRRRRL